jgi:hypothetical protein
MRSARGIALGIITSFPEGLRDIVAVAAAIEKAIEDDRRELRSELLDEVSYRDLRASGGIVGAP